MKEYRPGTYFTFVFIFSACLLLLAQGAPSQTPGTLRWNVSTHGHVISSPAIAEDGTIYVGAGSSDLDASNLGWLYSISPGGTTNWVLPFPGAVRSSPAIGSDGRIYVGCMNGDFIIASATGQYSTVPLGGGILSSPAIGADGTIYVGALSNYFNKIYSLRPDGSMNWVFSMGAISVPYPGGGSEQNSSPAIGPDRTIYVGSIDGNLYSISPTGQTNWTFPLATSAGGTFCSPSIDSDGTIYIGAQDGILRALTPQGSERWEFSKGAFSPIESSPAIGPDGSIYFGCVSGGASLL